MGIIYEKRGIVGIINKIVVDLEPSVLNLPQFCGRFRTVCPKSTTVSVCM